VNLSILFLEIETWIFVLIALIIKFNWNNLVLIQ